MTFSESESLAPSASAEAKNTDHTGWTEICIAVDPKIQDQLLVQVLRPFVSEKKSAGPARVFFVRDRVDLVKRLHIFLADCSPGEIQELAQAFRSAAQQAQENPEIHVVPDSPLQVVLGPYSGREAATIVSDFFVDACRLLLDEIAEIAAGRANRMQVAMDIMLSHLNAVDVVRIFPERYPSVTLKPGLPTNFAVFRANVDGFFVMSTDPQAARAQIDAQYERQSAAIQKRVQSVLAQFEGGEVVSPTGVQWHKIARAHLYRADAAVARNGVEVKWDDGWMGDNFDISISPFHQVVQRSPHLREFYKRDQGYLALRVISSSMYMLLSSLGIRLIDRVMLCHSICRACETLYHENTTDLMTRMSGAVAAMDASKQSIR